MFFPLLFLFYKYEKNLSVGSAKETKKTGEWPEVDGQQVVFECHSENSLWW